MRDVVILFTLSFGSPNDQLPTYGELVSSGVLSMLSLIVSHNSNTFLCKAKSFYALSDQEQTFFIIFPFLRVSSGFVTLDWCLTNQGRLPRLSEGFVASTFVDLLLQTGTGVLSYSCVDLVELIRLIQSDRYCNPELGFEPGT